MLAFFNYFILFFCSYKFEKVEREKWRSFKVYFISFVKVAYWPLDNLDRFRQIQLLLLFFVSFGYFICKLLNNTFKNGVEEKKMKRKENTIRNSPRNVIDTHLSFFFLFSFFLFYYSCLFICLLSFFCVQITQFMVSCFYFDTLSV